jgi:transposase
MKLLYRRCAGLDVHKQSVSVCIRIRSATSKEAQVEEAVFGTITAELERLCQWLREHKVKQIAMESTGVYWIPVWNMLERSHLGFQLMLVNPQTVRALRGCKTDRIDARRIAEFLQYGLLRGSFVPPPPIRQLRDLTRMRVQVQADRNRVINRIGRLLETANLKLASVVSNIVGKTGRAILCAIAEGHSQPERLAELACGSLRNRKYDLISALNGRYTDHFQWLLGCLIQELQWLDGRLAELEWRIADQIQPHADLVRRLCTIPGVDHIAAWTLIAELGLDMSQFPDQAHLASWAGLCPGNAESAGKRFSGKTRKGNRYLRRMLVQSAWSVAHKKDCGLTAVFYRIAHRRGMKKAAIAVAHRILLLAYHIIRDGGHYREPGGDFIDRQDPERTAQRLRRRLERIGYQVVLTRPDPASPAAPRAPASKRGRPCKCAERGLICTHDRVTAGPPTGSLPHCPKCAKWGIPCIHARNQKLHRYFPASSTDSIP